MEDRFEIDIRGSRFVGIADLILRDRNTGAISVIDHKSKSMQSLTKDLRAKQTAALSVRGARPGAIRGVPRAAAVEYVPIRRMGRRAL